MIKQRNPDQLGIPVELRIDIEEYYDQVILPYRLAPVIRLENGQAVLLAMQFSLIPRWSKERKVKFATHNARLETIDEKATWRDAFQKRHCLIPMTHFIEPVYEGEFAGNMVAFHATNNGFLLAAGIWEEWVSKETGEVIQSFSIITSTPPPFIERTGHDRCPVFLSAACQSEWLKCENSEPSKLKSFLNTCGEKIDFSVEKHRAMRPGWEKRR